jgi:hypothetical protein
LGLWVTVMKYLFGLRAQRFAQAGQPPDPDP